MSGGGGGGGGGGNDISKVRGRGGGGGGGEYVNDISFMSCGNYKSYPGCSVLRHTAVLRDVV